MELDLFYDGQFWVGIFRERGECGGSFVARHIFGADEPSDAIVYEFIQTGLGDLVFYPDDVTAKRRNIINPKRLARWAKRQAAECRDRGTKAQRQLKLMQKADLAVTKAAAMRVHKQSAQDKFEQGRIKRKEKRKGR